MAHSRSFLANQKARNAIVGAENLLKLNILYLSSVYVYRDKFIFQKQIIQLKTARLRSVKDSNWQRSPEANQLAIYKRSRGVELGTAVKQLQLLS